MLSTFRFSIAPIFIFLSILQVSSWKFWLAAKPTIFISPSIMSDNWQVHEIVTMDAARL